MPLKFKKCLTKFCRGVASPELWKSPYCSKCRSRRWREKHPIAAAFHRLRTHAKERGHQFSITFDYFKKFITQSDYIKNRGTSKFGLHIDRIDETKGYAEGNLQVITNLENQRKRYVPYFKNKAEEEAAIAETTQKIKEAYNL